MTKIASMGGLMVTVGLVVAGCGSSAAPPSGVSPSLSVSASSVPSASASASPSASPSATASGTCTSDIRVDVRPMSAAAGHTGVVLVFNNVAKTSCRMIGYPGVDLVSASGATVAHATRTLRGYMGGEPETVTAPQPVDLAPGASASAVLEASDVPQNGITNCGSYALRITPPEQTVSVPGGTGKLPRCGLQIHPVVAGIASLG